MTAEEARKLTNEHSKKVQAITQKIEKSARQGNFQLCLHTGEASTIELDALRKRGFKATYETSETDGGQYILINWEP